MKTICRIYITVIVCLTCISMLIYLQIWLFKSKHHETALNANELYNSKSNVCAKGGEELFNRKWILEQLLPFLETYNRRPSKDNHQGTRIMHQFALWCFLKHLKPDYVIESGIYKGMGTWIIRQALPMAKLVLIDPINGSSLAYRDGAHSTEYLIGDNFKDFRFINWTDYVIPDKSLVFIDDHRYPVSRIDVARKWGFKHIVFDDNYWNYGDVFSFKKACAILLGQKLNKKQWTINDKVWSMESNRTRKILEDYKETFYRHVQIYYEFPMLWHSPFCDTNSDSKNELFDITEGYALVKQYVSNLPPSSEINGYFNIAYVLLQ